VAREKLIGVLDIQSTKPEAFTQSDIAIFQTMADQIAVAIENVRLLSDSQLIISQLESFSREQTRESWKYYHRTGKSSFYYSPTGIHPVADEPVLEEDDKIIEVPLSVRGQLIGKITLKRKSDSLEWTKQEQGVAEEVAAQTALALDNARLIEQTQNRAGREQAIASIANKVRETLDLQAILRTSAREIQRALNLEEAEIRLVQPESSARVSENPD
jgi:GAF domain-containing protein